MPKVLCLPQARCFRPPAARSDPTVRKAVRQLLQRPAEVH